MIVRRSFFVAAAFVNVPVAVETFVMIPVGSDEPDPTITAF